MANPYTDQRALLARLQQQNANVATPMVASSASPGPSPSKAGITLSNTATKMAITNPALRAKIEAIAANKSQGGGILGKVLKPLELLALPGRAVIGGVREFADVVDSDPNTNASFGDFRKNMADPTFGFGKAFKIDTGNIWVDRAIGLAGDIALDPLTYLTAGTGKFASMAGHVDMAGHVLKLTGDGALAGRVAKYGRGAAGLTDDILQGVGANRHGLYMFGKRLGMGETKQGFRIPGTGALGQMADSSLSKLRVSVMGTKGGKFLQKITMDKDMLEARMALRQGTLGSTDAVRAIIGAIQSQPLERMTVGTIRQAELAAMEKFIKELEVMGVDSYGDDLHKMITSEGAYNAGTAEQRALVDAIKEKFAYFETNVDAARQVIDDTSPPFGMKDYFPMMQTDDAIAFRSSGSAAAEELNTIYRRDPLEGGRNFKTRTLEEGDNFFGHTLTQQDIDGGIEALNEIASRPGTGFTGKFFETDVKKVLTKYVDSYAQEMGILEKHKFLVESGFWTHAENVTTGKYVLDKELINSVKKNIRTLDNDLKALHYSVQKSHIGFSQALDDYAKQLQETLTNFKGATGELGQMETLAASKQVLEDALSGSLNAGADELRLLADNLGNMKAGYAKLMGLEISGKNLVVAGTEELADAPMTLDSLISTIDDVQREVYALGEQMDNVVKDRVGVELEDAAKQAELEFKKVENKMKELVPRIQNVTQFANQLESAFESLATGSNLADLNEHVVKVVAMAMRDGQIGSDTVQTWIKEQFDFSGRLETALRNLNNEPGSLFERTNQIVGTMKIDNVTKMKTSDFYDNLTRMYTGDMSMANVREMAVYTLLNNDLIYGYNIPELLKPLRAKLEDLVEKSAQAESFADTVRKADTTGNRMSAAKIWESQWDPAYTRAVNDREAIPVLESFRDSFNAVIKDLEDPALLDRPITDDMLEAYYNKYPFLEQLVPQQQSAESFITDLMNGSMVTNGEMIDGLLVSDVGLGRGAGDSVERLTFRELLSKVETTIAQKKAMFDTPVYEIGPGGVGQQKYTGNQIIGRYERVRNLKNILSGLNQDRAKQAEYLFNQADKAQGGIYRDLFTAEKQARYAELKEINQKRALSPAEKKEFTLFEKADNLKLESETRAAQVSGADRYQELDNELAALTGGGSLVRPDWFTSEVNSRMDLANSILEYQMVSEVHTRFNAIARYTEAMGYIPTESMFAKITEGVSSKFMPILDSKISESIRASVIMKRIDEEISVAINAGRDMDGVSIGALFKQKMAGLTAQERKVVEAVIGHRVSWGADPYSIFRGKSAWVAANVPAGTKPSVARRMWIEAQVLPWYEKAYPKGPKYLQTMEDALKDATKRSKAAANKNKLMTPWADDATPDVVKSWFEDIIGKGNSSIGGRRARDASAGATGEIEQRIYGLKKVRANYKTMIAPDMNMEDFFLLGPQRSQKTPSLYAQFLQDYADDLERRIADKRAIDKRIVDPVTGRPQIANVEELVAQEKGKIDGYLAGTIDLPDDITAEFKVALNKKRAAVEAQKAVEDSQKALDDSVTLKPELDSINKTSKSRWLTKEEKARKVEIEKQVKKLKDNLAKAKEKGKKVEKLTAKEQKFFVGLTESVDESGTKTFEYVPTKEPLVPKGKKAQAAEDLLQVGEENPIPREAARALSQYNDAMQTPLHAKSKQDEQLVRVMQALAGFDMHKVPKFVSAADGSTVATYATGVPITFSDAQWRSLFHGHTSEQLSFHRGKAQIALNTLRTKVRTVDRQLAEMNTAYNELMAKNPVSARRTLKQMSDEIKLVESQRYSLLNDIDEQKIVVESLGDGVQSVALGKLKILVEGRFAPNGDMVQAPIFDDNGLTRWLAHEHPTQSYVNKEKFGGSFSVSKQTEDVLSEAKNTQTSFVQGMPNSEAMRYTGLTNDADRASARAANVAKSWEASLEYAHLQRMSQLESNSFIVMLKHQQGKVGATEDLLEQVKARLGATLVEAQDISQGMSAVRKEIVDTAEQGSNALENLRGTGVTVPQEQFTMPGYPAWDTYPDWVKRDIIENNKIAHANNPKIQLLPEEPALVPAEPFPLSALSTPEEIRAYAARMEEQAMPSGPLVNSATGSENVALGRVADEAMSLEAEYLKAGTDKVRARQAADEWQTGSRGESASRDVGYSKESQDALRAMEGKAPREAGRRAALNEVRAAFNERLKVLTTAEEVAQRIQTKLGDIEEKILSYGIDGGDSSFWTKLEDNRVMADLIQKKLDDVNALIESRPEDALKILKDSVKGRKTSKAVLDADVQNALDLYRQWWTDNYDIIRGVTQSVDELDNPVYDAWTKAANAEIELIDTQLKHTDEIRALARASWPVWHETTFTTLDKGYEKAAKESGMLNGMSKVDGRNFPSLYGNTEALDLLKGLERLRTPGVSRDLAKFMGSYTGYFRSYATLSPGFHVRNLMSNVFSMFTAGAQVKNMTEGFRLWRKLVSTLDQGGTLADFVAALPAEQQMAGRRAAEVMFGMGGGKTADALRGFTEGGNILKDNALLRFSRRTGGKVEGSGHFVLAYDSMMQGFTPEQAFNRTRRYLIDYQAKTILDDSMRDIIPFWMWMSRNLPLQIVNRWTNPKAYLTYQKFVNNISSDEDGDVVPNYLSKRGAVSLGGGNFFNPDLPISGLDQQISDITNPNKWLSYVNPGIRTPIELMTNRNTFTGQPFDNTYVPISAAIKPFVPILSAMGQIEHNSKGEQVVSRKALYALTSMNPVLARADRMSPSDVASAKSGNAMNGFLGIPFTQVDAGMQDSERYRRIAQLKALQAKQQNLGFGGQ